MNPSMDMLSKVGGTDWNRLLDIHTRWYYAIHGTFMDVVKVQVVLWVYGSQDLCMLRNWTWLFTTIAMYYATYQQLKTNFLWNVCADEGGTLMSDAWCYTMPSTEYCSFVMHMLMSSLCDPLNRCFCRSVVYNKLLQAIPCAQWNGQPRSACSLKI